MTVAPAERSTTARARFAPPPRRTIAVALVVVAADQLSKHWAVTSLPGRPPVHVIWTLRWNLSFNRGMSFSRFQDLGPVIAVLAIVISVWVAISVGRLHSPLASVAGGLIVGGALGNVIDRLFRGKGWLHGGVVDFIDLQWFPIFNIADAAINVGGAVFLIWSLTAHHGLPR